MISSRRLKGTVSHNQFVLKEPPPLNTISLLGLTDNNPEYVALVNEINAYNQKLRTGALSQTYEHSVYEQLATILKNVKEGNQQKQRVLSDTQQWLQREKRKVQYERELKQLFKQKHKPRVETNYSLSESKELDYEQRLDNYALESSKLKGERTAILPYIRGNRSAILDIDLPSERLKEYTRKQLIAIDRTASNNTSKKPSRVVYKVQPYRLKQETSQLDIQPDTTAPAESIEADRQLLPEMIPAESPALENNDGSIGEQIEEDAEQEEIVEDRLAPNTKPYTKAAIEEEDIPANKQQSAFAYHKEAPTPAMKSTNQRYLKFLNKQYRGVSEEKEVRKHFYQWAKEKARAAKQVSRKQEVKVLRVLVPKAKKADPVVVKISENLTDLSTALPTLNQHKEKLSCVEFESSIYTKKLVNQKLLLKKSTNMNANPEEQDEDQETPVSRVKITSISVVEQRKYRSLGSILDEFSPEKEQSRQLDEVHRVKAKLAKYGDNSLTIKQLTDALVTPLIKDNPDASFPKTVLPNNPFFVAPKTKKKKKK